MYSTSGGVLCFSIFVDSIPFFPNKSISLLFYVRPLKNFNSSASGLKSLKIGSASSFNAITKVIWSLYVLSPVKTLLHMPSTFLFYDFKVIIRFAVVNFIKRWNISITDIWHISQAVFIQCPFNNFQCTRCFHGTQQLFVVGTAIVLVFPFIVVLIIMPFSPCLTTLRWFWHDMII